MKKLFGKPEGAWLISAVVASALLVGALFVPLWSMELVAPQYPEGLVMYAYGDHFEGDPDSYYDDVREINGLNHYIGMKPIEKVTEMDLFIPGVIATIIAALAVSFIAWKRGWFRIAMIAGFWFMPIFFIADLQYWLYNYGHTMDESSALDIESFTPKVWGTTKVLNFHSETGFEIGFYLMVGAALIITFLPMVIRRIPAGFITRWRREQGSRGVGAPAGAQRA
ncbi:MAG TPA: cytochrome C [Dehalococcoidia bacterium]|nr:cytochrome C [Dehalococcoidia bacterium]